jgi:small basic protein (TIGR04137 family)
MSIHKSLVPASKLRRHRNVLTRSERLEVLKQDGRWTDEKSVFGLAKVRNIMMKAKAKKKEEAAAEGAEAAAPAAGAAPAAAGAAPAKGAVPAKGAAGAPAKGAAPAAAAKGAAPAKKEEKKK